MIWTCFGETMRLGLITLAVGLVATACMAETITLRDGRSVQGDVIRTNAASITVRTKSGIQTYQFSELANPPEHAATTSLSKWAITGPARSAAARWITPALIPCVIFFICLLHIFFPRMFWFFSKGWMFRGDVEPSSTWLAFTQLGGVVGVIIFGYVIYMMTHHTPIH
jgi:hypothetical protein